MGDLSLEKVSETYLDVLKEIGNIGAGNAMTALSQMLNCKVDMKVPQVKLLDFNEVGALMGGEEQMCIRDRHMPVGFTASLAERLDKLSQLHVKEAAEGEELKKGWVYIAMGGKHLNVVTSPAGRHTLHLSEEPYREGVRPCANYMYESMQTSRFDSVVCAVMTGMGSDGTEGIGKLKASKKSYVIAQDQDTSVVFGMPKSIIAAGLADQVVPLDQIAQEIILHVGVVDVYKRQPLGTPNNWLTSVVPKSASLLPLVTRIPVDSEINREGIWLTRPSPIVRIAYLFRALVISMPCLVIPMMIPPTILMVVISRPATASPFTYFTAPSMEPKKLASSWIFSLLFFASASVMAPVFRSASIAICLPGIASRVNLAVTSDTRSEPLLMTINWIRIRMMKIMTPMTRSPPPTNSPKVSTTLPALPSLRIRRVDEVFSAIRKIVVNSSIVGKKDLSLIHIFPVFCGST